MKIKLLIMDVDGTLTDGKLYLGENGTQLMKVFDIKDGYGIHDLLPSHCIKSAIITGDASAIVKHRAEKLNVDYLYQNVADKVPVIWELSRITGIHPEEMAFIGDDLMDKESMLLCGLKGCPADAVEGIREVSDFVCDKIGGQGAVREFIEWIINKCT